MNKTTHGFFALTEVTDPNLHVEFNRWHACEHQPENKAIYGVVLGDRWAAPKRYMESRIAVHPDLAGNQYLSHYMFTGRVEDVLKEFPKGERTGHTTFKERKGWSLGFHPLRKTYVASRLRLSPEALPYRPNRGVLFVVKDLIDPAKEEETARWHDEVHIPDVLTLPGVMGCYWYQSTGKKIGEASPISDPSYRQVFVYYLDEDPMEVLGDLKKKAPGWAKAGRMLDTRKSMRGLLTGCYMSVRTPEHFDWPSA